MSARSCLLIVVTAFIVPASAGAATLPPRAVLGPAQGITASGSGRTLTVGFTGAAAAWGTAHAGRKVEAECGVAPPNGPQLAEDPAPSPDSDDSDESGGGSGSGRVAADGASVRIALDAPAGDACTLNGAPGWAVPPSGQVAYAALTPAGAALADETLRALRMADVIHAARPHGAYAPAADAVALGGGEVVALDDPNGTPPPGQIGYWSKGRALSVVALSSAGRRLVIQDLGGGMLRSNALQGLVTWAPVTGFKSDPSDSGDDDDGGGDTSASPDLGAGDSGVHAHLSAGRVTFRFTGASARTYRRYAGRRLVVACSAAPPRALLGEALTVDAHPAVTHVRVPRHGGVIRGDAPAGHQDLCVVETATGADLATAVLTRAARGYVMDIVAPLAFALSESSPLGLVPAGATRYPGAATLAAAHAGLVPLLTPGGHLKEGQFGVWTDADQQALVATVLSDGRRYLFADEGHGMVRTNLYTGLLGVMNTVFASPQP